MTAPTPTGTIEDAVGDARDASGSNAVSTVSAAQTAAPPPAGAPATANGYDQIGTGAPVGAQDTDQDGLTDAFEKLAMTNPLVADSDSDGLTDGYEALKSHTDPLSADTDKDSIPDAAEIAAGSDPGAIAGIAGVSGLGEHAQNVRGGVLDSDADGLTDPYEMQMGTNPHNPDSDADTLTDNMEAALGTNAMMMDTDLDGLTDAAEVQYGMDPGRADAGTGPLPEPPVGPAVPVLTAPAPPVPAPPAAPDPMQTVPTSGSAGGQVQQMLDAAMAQVGDQYVFGAEVSETDPNPSVWDCAEFTQWSAHQVGAKIPGSSFEQYLDLKAQGLVIPVEQAMNTPGALLFHFSSEPQPGGGRPSEAHVALSTGGGRTVEAHSTQRGVDTFDSEGRFEYAALLPGVDYTGGAAAVETAMPAAAAAPMMSETDASGLNLEMVVHGIKMQESRGDYVADNPTSTASGAYQYIDGTWNGYGGYSHASDAPPDVQDAKMMADTQAAYDKLGDWERVIASHFAGEGEQAGPKSDWEKVPGYDYNHNPSIREYVDGVLGHISEADPAEFGGASFAMPAAAPPAAMTPVPPVPLEPPVDPNVAAQQFVDAALRQQGDAYQFGAEAEMGNADPTTWDRSELVQWAAHQAGIAVPDGSSAQYLELKAQGLLIPVEQAAHTPGALLFTFSSEPTPGGARPDVAQVAISQGNGKTVEADDANGVSVMDVGTRFQYAAVLPGLKGVTPTPQPPPAVPAQAPADAPPGFEIDPGVDISNPDADADDDGLSNQFESLLGTNPTAADTDSDGLIDGFEVSLGTDPTRMDSDADGFTDGFEALFGMDPLAAAAPGSGPPMPDSLGSPLGPTLPDAGAAPDPLGAEPDPMDAGADPVTP